MLYIYSEACDGAGAVSLCMWLEAESYIDCECQSLIINCFNIKGVRNQ